MMLTSPRRRGHKIAKVEALESRDLMANATAGPTQIPPPQPPIIIVPPPNPADSYPGPKVAFVQFEPLTGRVLVAFSGDLAGYSTATLTNPANYSLSLVNLFSKLPSHDESRPKAGVVLAPTFQVTGVTLSTPVAPGNPQSLIVQINNNQPLREGVYQFTIRGAGITDLAGRPLDGAYSGVFPSGDGQPGSDFSARLTTTHNTVLPAQPIIPPPAPPNPNGIVPGNVFLPAPTRTLVRYAPAKPGKFMLAGGNNITLIALQNQNFPGTFRVPVLPPTPLPFEASQAKKRR